MRRAIIAGAGMAGTATALLLNRIGWDVEILEAGDAQNAPAGAFLNVAANGQAVLETLGVRDRLLSDAHFAPEMAMWSGRGKLLGVVPNGPAGRPDRGGSVVRRDWLRTVLTDAVADAGIPVHYRTRLHSVTSDDTRATARWTSGGSAEVDLIIGADGIGSTTRSFVNPGTESQYTGLVGLGGFAHDTGLAPTPGAQSFVFGHRSFFGYLVRDDSTVYWFANVTMPDTSRDELASVPPAQWLDRLRDLHADDPEPVRRILQKADNTVAAYSIRDLPTVPRWSRGRVVLTGDAVHATSPSAGQGASLALEDAQTLVQALRDLPDIPAALQAYEQVRRPRAEAVVAYSREISNRKQTGTGLSAWIRDLMLPHFLKRAATDTRSDWLYEPLPDFDTPFSARTAPTG